MHLAGLKMAVPGLGLTTQDQTHDQTHEQCTLKGKPDLENISSGDRQYLLYLTQ